MHKDSEGRTNAWMSDSEQSDSQELQSALDQTDMRPELAEMDQETPDGEDVTWNSPREQHSSNKDKGSDSLGVECEVGPLTTSDKTPSRCPS